MRVNLKRGRILGSGVVDGWTGKPGKYKKRRAYWEIHWRDTKASVLNNFGGHHAVENRSESFEISGSLGKGFFCLFRFWAPSLRRSNAFGYPEP